MVIAVPVRDPDLRDRVRGSLLGLAVGDALCPTVELALKDTLDSFAAGLLEAHARQD